MQHCKFCGAELPNHARFCGHCGNTLQNTVDNTTEFSDTPTLNAPPSGLRTPPIKPVKLMPMHGAEDQEPASNPPYSWPAAANEQQPPLISEQQDYIDEWRKRGMILGAPFLALLQEGQAPDSGAPMVQGAPQAGNVPQVQGTPSVPSNPPAGQPFVHNVAPSPPSVPPGAASWVPHTPISSSSHHQATEPHPGYHPHHETPAPMHHHPRHTSGELAHHHVSGELPTGPLTASHHRTHARRQHSHHTHRLATTLIITAVAIVVIVTSGIGAALAIFHPSLSLSGSASVTHGSTLLLHGRNFMPGSSVTLTLDNGIPLTYVRHTSTSGSATALQMSIMAQLEQATSSNTSIPVNSSGNFDVSIPVSASWPVGAHTIHAVDSVLGRSADLQFTIVTGQARLQVTPGTLDFKAIEKGKKAILAVIVGNAGEQPLSWTAGSGAPAWLTVQPGAGTIFPGSLAQTIYVTADTTSLALGDNSATLHISSNAGDAQVAVKISVVPPGSNKQAVIDVNPKSLNFGTQPAGQQVTLKLTIGNTGPLPLSWKASTGNTGWLSLSNTTGKVLPGASPQSVNVTADTTRLQAGNYSAQLTIQSNGGNVQVGVTMIVSAPVTPGPNGSPTTVTPPSPRLTENPSRLDFGSLKAGTQNVLSVNIGNTGGQPLTWNADTGGATWLTLDTTTGTIQPGGPQQTINVTANTAKLSAGNYSATLTITSNGGNVQVPVILVVPPPPPAQLTVGSSSLDFGTLQQGKSATLHEVIGNTGGQPLTWNADTGGATWLTLDTTTGTIQPGGPQQTINVTANTAKLSAGNYSTTLNITSNGGNSQVSVTLVVIPPPSITATLGNCSYSAGQGWTCNATVSSDANNQGNLAWSASGQGSATLNAISFTPSAGNLSPGQSTPVTISIADSVCPASATFTFTGPANNVPLNWSCNAPTISISDSSGLTTGCTQCTVIIQDDPNSQGEMSWSATSYGLSSGVSGIGFSPSKGTLWPGNTQSVSVSVTFSGCGQSATISFAAYGASTVTATWISGGCIQSSLFNPHLKFQWLELAPAAFSYRRSE